jgi:hypothetical protein
MATATAAKPKTKSAAFKKICKSFDVDYKEIPEITSFEDACKALKLKTTCLPDVSAFPTEHQQALLAHAQLIIIAQALNEGWKPNWNDTDQWKYYPWFEIQASEDKPSGFGFSGAFTITGTRITAVGSRLCFKSRSLAIYAGKQFAELYKQYFLLS